MTEREQYIVGVDLGGTNIVAGAMTSDGSRHLAMRSIPTNAFVGDEGVAERIVALVEGVKRWLLGAGWHWHRVARLPRPPLPGQRGAPAP